MTLDHLVYATPDVEESVRYVAGLTGVWPVEGGRHVGGGTRNYLLGLGGLRYLEIVGPDREQPEPARPLFPGIGGPTGRHRRTGRPGAAARLRPGPGGANVPHNARRRDGELATDTPG